MDNIRNFRQEQAKRFLKKNRNNLITLLAVLLISCFFIFAKEGYHMDEMLSFELANAEFTPWIVPTQPEGRLEKFVQNEIYGESFGETCGNIIREAKDVIKNRGESKMLSYKADVYEEPVWISAKQFKDYITTEGHSRFNYLSVYFNNISDTHPPLFYMVLHTISSLFPGKQNAYMGGIINLVCILGICILLMKICQEFLDKEELGRAVCILYACSMAGIATVLLIRMYAMLTFFCMAALYLHLKKMQTGEWERHNGKLILVTVCGFLTQYYFVVFMLFLAGVSVYHIIKKYGRKALLCYIRTMGISAVLGLCICPYSIADVLYGDRGAESVENLKNGFSGLGERILAFSDMIKEEVFNGAVGIGILLLMVIAAFAAWLFRKNAESAELAEVKKKEKEKSVKRKGSLACVYQMIGIPAIGYFLVVVKIAPYYVDRYLMPIFPLIALWIGILLWKSLDCLKYYWSFLGRKGILTILVILMVLPNIDYGKAEYLYQGYRIQKRMSEVYADTACVCVYDGVGYYENLPEFTNYKKTLLVTKEELLNRKPDKVLEEEEKLVVIYKYNSDPENQIPDYLAEKYGFQFSGFLVRKAVHGEEIVIYEKQK